MRRHLAAILMVGAVALAGCGEDGGASDDSSPGAATTSPSPSPSAPECTEVWQEGEKLPTGYDGCVADGSVVEPDTRLCSSGQILVRYSSTHYAVRGGPVQQVDDLDTDREYQSTLRTCTG